MTINVTKFNQNLSEDWDNFCERSWNGTFQQTRKFLNYHLDRFCDTSFIFHLDNKIVGVMPLAENPLNPSEVLSHPGSSFGGLIRTGEFRGENVTQAYSLLQNILREEGYSRLTVKHVPYIYHKQPCQDEEYSLWKLGATISQARLSSTIDLKNSYSPSSRRKRGRKLASQHIQVVIGNEFLPQLWDVVINNLSSRHGVSPVHTLFEFKQLVELFPSQIQTFVALHKEEVIAGVTVFKSSNVWHAQYIASNDLGREYCALDLVFHNIIENAQNESVHYFDFGISNEDEGKTLNSGLYNYKSEFGGGGTIHTYSSLEIMG